jgi:hypothetical protein
MSATMRTLALMTAWPRQEVRPVLARPVIRNGPQFNPST